MPALLLSLVLIAGRIQDPPFWAYGVGNSSCGRWTERHPAGDTATTAMNVAEQSWVLGFVSGVGAGLLGSPNVKLRKTDTAAIVSWVTNYCRDNPLEEISDAAQSLVVKLFEKR